MSLAVDGGGDLWVGTHGAGLDRFDSGTGSFRVYRHDPASAREPQLRRRDLHGDGSPGTLWVGTDGGGLNAFDRRSGQFRHFAHDPEDANSLGSNAVFSLHVDGKGRVWVGMRGAGPGPAREPGRRPPDVPAFHAAGRPRQRRGLRHRAGRRRPPVAEHQQWPRPLRSEPRAVHELRREPRLAVERVQLRSALPRRERRAVLRRHQRIQCLRSAAPASRTRDGLRWS